MTLGTARTALMRLASPRYACCTAALARICAGGPLSSTWPLTITVMTSATANTASMSCSTSRIAWCGASCFRSATIRAASSAPMPASGSSSSSTSGCVASTIAISSCRCSPCDSADATRSRRPASPAAASARSAPSDTGRYATASVKMRSARGARDCAASRQFSNAVNAGKMFVFW